MSAPLSSPQPVEEDLAGPSPLQRGQQASRDLQFSDPTPSFPLRPHCPAPSPGKAFLPPDQVGLFSRPREEAPLRGATVLRPRATSQALAGKEQLGARQD